MGPSKELRTQPQPAPQFTDTVPTLQEPEQTQILFFYLESTPCRRTFTCLPGGEV